MTSPSSPRPMKIALLSLVFLVSAVTNLLAQAGNQTAKVTATGRAIGYYEYLPPGYATSGSQKWPVVFFMHGQGEKGNGTTELLKITAAGPPKIIRYSNPTWPFILISPQLKATEGQWTAAYIDEVVEYCKTYLRIDETRIYITGLSLGGGGAWTYAQTYPQKIAALAPVCGGYNNPAAACNITKQDIPTWAFHGDKDNVVPIGRTTVMINAMNACVPAPNPAPIYTIYPGVYHNAWDYAYRNDHSLHNPNVYEWLLQFKNEALVVNAGLDKAINLPTSSVVIAGTASTGVGSTITSYAWTKVSGGSATLANTATANLSVTGLSAGVYTFRLTATNSKGETGYDEMKLTVSNTNLLPIANAGPDIALQLPTNGLTVNGSGSDQDGTITSYLWTKVSGPLVTMSGTTTPYLVLSAMASGTFVFSLKVTDNLGATSTDEVIVTVAPLGGNTPPVANAGADKTINLPTNSTNLTGTGSDANGTVVSYLWEKLTGPNVTLANATTPTVSLSNLLAGVYTFRLTVTDNGGATGQDQVVVTVTAANQAPVANAGADITLTLPINSTIITGLGTDSDGTISSYAWTQSSGPNTATLANASTAVLTTSNLVAGTYVFQLQVTDDKGSTSIDNVNVIVNPAAININPVANAGADQSITLPTNSLNLVGTGSDADGTITTYAWTKVSGPAGSLSGQNTATLSLSALLQGTYIFALTVTDNLGATATDNVTLVVNPPAVNQVPTANAGPDFTVNLPTSTANLSGSGSDPDGTIASYLWEKVSGPTVTLTNANTPNLSVSALSAGVYTFRLTVTDNGGATGQDVAVVTVTAANVSPTANAGADISITLPTSATNITGAGTDPDGSIASYAWTQVSGPNTATLTNTLAATVTATALIEGTYVFRLTVTDDKGATGTDEVSVVVNAAIVNVIPVANAGPDRTITLPVNTVTLNGSGTDTDGTITTYAWTKVSGPVATITNANTPSLTASAMPTGVYVFRLTVTDNSAATAFDEVTVNVLPAPPNNTPVANAGPDIAITLPTNTAVLNGSGTDSDGTISAYAWTKLSGPTATSTNQTTPSLSLSNLLAGVYVFQLTVTDNGGATNSDDVTVVVSAANLPPLANAGPDITINLPIDATPVVGGGTDADGTVASYLWEHVSGPNTTTFSSTTTATTTASGLIAGTYNLKLTVTDDDGATGVDFVKITVNAANQSPVANAGADKTITLPTSSANFTATATDADGTIASYSWAQTGGPAAILSNGNSQTLTVDVTLAGLYTFTVTVTDNQGATDFDEVTLLVSPAVINQLPIVNAGTNTSISLPQSTLVLTGTASDADGTIATYLWTKVNGPSVTMTNTNNPSVSLSDLLEGSYTFRLTATDNSGGSAFAEVIVTVLPAAVNQPPVANAGTNKTITLPTNSITLFGSGSDPDGTVLTYEWSVVSGPAATVANETTPNLTVTDMLQGTYVFRLTVTDQVGATGTDDVSVTVNPVATNINPIANAGPDVSITLPTNSVNLNGSGSDADGSITVYSWTKISGPAASLGATNLPTLSISALLEGTYTFRLEVTDNGGAKASDNVIVTVLPAAINQAPTVNAGADITLVLPTNATLITGTANDPEGQTLTLAWTKQSGPAATLGTATGTSFSVSALVEGVYVFRLTATDPGGSSAFDEVTVTVNSPAVNQLPVANAGADKTITLPLNSTTIFGSGSDADGTITAYSWTKVSGPAATLANETTATLSVTDLVQGVYRFSLSVTDDDGATGLDEVIVTVNAAATNQPPIANAGPNVIVTLPTNIATLIGSGSDPDGSIAKYTWSKVSGASVSLGATNGATLSLSNLLEGLYTFRLEVEDNNGAKGFDDVNVTVLPATVNQAPVTNAGADQSIFLPTNTILLTGSASDSDGSIASVTWTRVSGPTATLVNASTVNLTVNNLLEGTYIFRLSAIDNSGASSFDEVTVVVNPAAANQPPLANAGPDRSIKLPTNSLTLTGSGSDPESGTITYLWNAVSGPAATMANETTATLSLSNLLEGSYVFSLTVTDDKGASATDFVNVTVTPAAVNEPPVVSAGADITIELPVATGTLTGNASDDGTIASVEWSQLSGPAATLSGETTNTLSLSGLEEGVYKFIFIAFDDQGESSSDEVIVTVLPEPVQNQPPTIVLDETTTIYLPTNSVSVVAMAEDPDGLINLYTWTQTSGSPVTILADSANVLEVGDLAEGIYVFKLTVTDDAGLTAEREVTINVLKEATSNLPFRNFFPESTSLNANVAKTWVIPEAEKLTAENCEVHVYNRQGQQVFESIGYASEWNGTFQGKTLPEGVYFYVIRCPGSESQTGSVTIIR